MNVNIEELKQKALAATPGPWMHLFGDRFVYDRLEDGCRGNPIVGVDYAVADVRGNLDYVAAANPSAILALIAERDEAVRIALDAATSLETIHIRSYGNGSNLNHPEQMRSYAGTRAGVVRKGLKDAGIES